MTKKNIVITTIVFLLYVSGIGFFASQIYTSQKKGHTQAQFEFENLQMVAGIKPDMSATYIDSLKSSIKDNERIAAITIQKNGSTIFAYPLDKNFMGMNSKGEPIIQVSSPFLQTYSSNFAISETENASITSAIYTVTPNEFSLAIKTAFILVTLGTLISIIFAIIQLKSKAKTTSTEKNDEDYSFTLTTEERVQASTEEKKPTEDETTFIEETTSDLLMSDELYEKEINSLLIDEDTPLTEEFSTDMAENEDYIEQTTNDDNQPEVAAEIESIFSGMDSDAVKNNALTSNLTMPKKAKQIDPMGLFSLNTGLGWESYFETRLDAELIRSTSSEQNLALFLIKVASIDHKNELAEKFAEVLTKHFNYRDLMFEYDLDGYAIIIPDIDFEQAMIEAESIYLDIKEVVNEARIGNSIGIGISSSAKRLITGSRLINEANLALTKSFEEIELPIVAFRVNTDKYRKYLNEELRLGLPDIKEEVIGE